MFYALDIIFILFLLEIFIIGFLVGHYVHHKKYMSTLIKYQKIFEDILSRNEQISNYVKELNELNEFLRDENLKLKMQLKEKEGI